MTRAILCTQNPHKVQEIREILPMLAWSTLADVGWDTDIPEEGETFEENALQKAQFVFDTLHDNTCLFVSDDSGLEIDALGGRPGVHSARYLGADKDYPKKCRGILSELGALPFEQRTARFVCVVAVRLPSGEAQTFRASCEGRIGWESRGEGGFGFDPIFLPADYAYTKTMAELTPSEKHRISHRGKAFRALLSWVEQEETHGLI